MEGGEAFHVAPEIMEMAKYPGAYKKNPEKNGIRPMQCYLGPSASAPDGFMFDDKVYSPDAKPKGNANAAKPFAPRRRWRGGKSFNITIIVAPRITHQKWFFAFVFHGRVFIVPKSFHVA